MKSVRRPVAKMRTKAPAGITGFGGLTGSGETLPARKGAARVIDWPKADGTTLVCAHWFDAMSSKPEGIAP